MQSFRPPSKLSCHVLIAAILVSIFAAQTQAQVYQIQPDGSVLQLQRYANPNFQQRTAEPQIDPNEIYPGQIINGERVVSPSVTTVQPNQSQPRSAPQSVDPPQPTASKSDPQNEKSSPPSTRPDKIPKTVLPIPEGPTLQSDGDTEMAPAALDPVTNETQLKSESSLVTEEKNDTDQSLDPVKTQSADAKTRPLEPATQETTANDPGLAPPSIDEDMMAEIKEIRAQLGGGISETLQGLDTMPNFGPIEIAPSLDAATSETDQELSPEALFNEQLRSVMSDQETASGPIVISPQSPRSTPSPVQPTYAGHTEELRDCARELEQLAGRLETIGAYENADQLRRQATQLWTTARQR